MRTIATRKEVAARAGVSEATVSRVLNDVGPIKEETRQRVLQAAKHFNYAPNAIAQSFARGKSGNLGVVLPYVPGVHLFSTFYFSEMLSGIGAAAKERGYDLLLKFRSLETDNDYELLFQRQKVDACIILGARNTVEERESLVRLQAAKLPFCLIGQHYEELRCNTLDADHVQGSYLAVKYLLDQGHARIAFLNGSPAYSNSQDRLKGYLKALGERGIAFDERLYVEGNYSRTSGYQAAPYILEQQVDAVFAGNDRMAIGFMQKLRELGRGAGQDMAIVGYDNSDAAQFTEPPLTSVAVPFYEMGSLAAAKLLESIDANDEKEIFQEKLSTHLVIR
ncbi:LacI family DNA-binding transcriptional regulator [Paenibacillus selenitireducens]|uniref:LacI family DNA-binding transcriptional regulator n=1 Tax=Paenibacillus selenitireducens TaxID=1324314 RepID=UPI0018EA1393|nr:LacI family DNA-binding transcriptional regulator [Paenibacillus selenitireducens]